MKARVQPALLALVIAGLVAAQPALARPSSPAAGSGEDISVTVVDERFADGNFYGGFVVTGVIEGTLDGSYVADIDVIIHSNGLVEAHGFLTFTGSIAGCDATTVRFRLDATGEFPDEGGPAVIDGRMVAVCSEVQASLAFDEVGNVFTYEGVYHCEQ
jgi:hypothetical protein